MVRERAVELAEEDVEVERQAVEHRGHDEAAHAVGGVGHDLQRAQRADVDERADVVGELVEQVALLDPARARRPARASPARDGRLDLGQAGVLADGRGARPGTA